jgi:hypothetical protein
MVLLQETPSQLLIFLPAANLGGLTKGFLELGIFLAGLLVMNTIMTASAAGLFGFSTRTPRIHYAITALTATYSLLVGSISLLGSSAFSSRDRLAEPRPNARAVIVTSRCVGRHRPL